MNQVEPAAAAGGVRYTGWDAAIALLLGLTLLGAGWLDVRSFFSHRAGSPAPHFAFMDPLDGQPLAPDELFRTPDSFALLDNVGALETLNGVRFRRAFGPASTILLTTNHPAAVLGVDFFNDIAGQDITIRCNDTVVEQFPRQPVGMVGRHYRLALRPGMNNISVGFARYNHGPQDLNSPDPRPLAGSNFVKLELNLE